MDAIRNGMSHLHVHHAGNDQMAGKGCKIDLHQLFQIKEIGGEQHCFAQ